MAGEMDNEKGRAKEVSEREGKRTRARGGLKDDLEKVRRLLERDRGARHPEPDDDESGEGRTR